ncbi:MAG: sulfate permease, partial [Desulfobacula sp.]|uniref:putative sulfate/molybdate transporter n=1 Tax=Desulfobacula sp. TaxID=2593537 RepID=UPI0025BC0310
LTGVYFGITVPVQPMKVIGAYSIATMMSTQQVLASSLLMGTILLVIGLTGTIGIIGKYIPKSVIRGIQLSTGTLLMAQGVKMMIGSSKIQNLYQMAEPYLKIQSFGPVPIGIVIGIVGVFITLILLDNKKMPAGLVIVLIGLVIGLVLGNRQELSPIRLGFYLPQWMPFGFPVKMDFMFAVFALVLPQIPMTLGNAVIANADLANRYFGEKSGKMTYKSLCISMAIGNFISFAIGGMPLCHGAGGLSAHYRFGARTAGSNLMIGFILMGLVLILGDGIFSFLSLIPMSILGILLIFAGSQLAMTILDVSGQKQMFVVVCILGVTLASNLAIGFGVGLVLANLLKSNRLNV